MASIPLTLRDRFSLVGRAIAGQLSLEPSSVGGRLLGGVIQPGGQPPTRGTREYLSAYSHMPWLRAVASRVSYDIAATEWEVLVERRAGRAVRNRQLQRMKAPQRDVLIARMKAAGELEALESHPLTDLLGDFNPVQTGLMARRTTQLHLDLVGEAFWLLERGAVDQIIAIWPVPPSWILGTPTPRFPFYRVSFRGWQGTIPESEFVHFSDVDPANPYGRGTGTAQALADELETDEYAAKHLKAFFHNRARPDLVVWPKGDQPLKEDEVRRLEEQWNSHSGGFWRAFRPFFLKREVEIKELDQNFRSMQMIQLREYERDTILQVYGVSPETLGIITPGASRATITMGDSIYARRVLVPRLELLRSVKQERLVPLFDERIILNYVSPVVKDQELELEAMKAAPWGPNVDEWRERQGLPPKEDGSGKVHIMSTLLAPTQFEEEPELPPMPALTPSPTPDGGDAAVTAFITQAEQDAKSCDEASDRETARLLRKYQKQARASSSDDPAPTRLADRQTAAYRRSQELSWQALSRRADINALERAIAAGRVDEALEAFGGPSAVVASVVDVLRARGKPAFLRGAELALESLPPGSTRAPVGINLADVNPEATRWAEREAATLVSAGTDAQASIRALIVLSNETGIAPREVARRIVQDNMVGLLPRQVTAVERFRQRLLDQGIASDAVARRASRYAAAQLRARAWSIARTELVSAVNAGQDALWQLAKQRGILPAGTKRVWLVTLDDALDQHICFVGRTPVLTLDGWKPISKVRVGEHVLTHRDRFKPVTKTMSRWHNGDAVRIEFGGRERVQATATANHPILTRRGWVSAGELTMDDDVAISAKPCARCGELIPYGPGNTVALCRPCRPIVINEKIWADPAQHERVQQQNARRWSDPAQRAAASEQMRRIASNPSDDTRAKLSAAGKRRFTGDGNPSKRQEVRRQRSVQGKGRVLAGTHPFLAENRTWVPRPLSPEQIAARTAAVKAWHAALTPDQKRAKLSAMMAGNSRSARGSKAERRLLEWLNAQSLDHVAQWPFSYRDGERERNGFADFMLPGARLVVECDGWFHFNDPETQRRDRLRDEALREQGLSVLRVNARDVERDLPSVASQVRAYCCLIWLKPKRIIHKTISHQPVYNLEVAEDHSYVAGGIVAHNCEPLTDAEAGLDEPFEPGGYMRPPAHPNCLVWWKTPIYTSEGWKPINSVAVGDLVLTHKGRFKPVTQLHRNKSADATVKIWLHNRRHQLSLTPNHPVLLAGGRHPRWVEAGQLKVGDEVQMLSKPCTGCATPTLEGEYCSNACATRGGKKWEKANAAVRQRVIDGVFVLQQPETRAKMYQALGRAHTKGTWLERKMEWALGQLGLCPMRHHPIPCLQPDSHNRRRYWYVDFAFPDLKIAIECDGERWHQDKARDARRQAEIESQGWTMLRFAGKEINADVGVCAERVARIANNHANGFTFGTFNVIGVDIVKRRQPYATYNLSVADDESYVAKGVVVHNCRCAIGLKTIPRR